MNSISYVEGTSVYYALEKFPSVICQDTYLYVNQKDVSSFLVDGKEFFKTLNSVSSLKSIPAYMVDHILVYERDSENVRGRMSALSESKEQVMDIVLRDEYKGKLKGELEVGASLPFYDIDGKRKPQMFGNAMALQSKSKSRIIANVGGDNQYHGAMTDTKNSGLDLYVNGLYQINKESRYQGTLSLIYNDEWDGGKSLIEYKDPNGVRTELMENFTRTYNKGLTTKHEFRYVSDKKVLGIFQNPNVYVNGYANLSNNDSKQSDVYLRENCSMDDFYNPDNDRVLSPYIYQNKAIVDANTIGFNGYAVASPVNFDRMDISLSLGYRHESTDKDYFSSDWRYSSKINRSYSPDNYKSDNANVNLNFSLALSSDKRNQLHFGDSYSIKKTNDDNARYEMSPLQL